MVMVRRGSQEWRELGQVALPPRPFTRTDGSVMSEEEIAKVATPETVWNKPDQPKRPRAKVQRAPTTRQTEAWDAVQRLGTITAAAKELGIDRTAVRNRLEGYMARAGIEGEIPGKVRGRRTPSTAGMVVPDVAVDAAVAELRSGAEINRQLREIPSSVPITEAFAMAAEKVRTDAAMPDEPVIAVVHMGDSEAHVRSYNEGFDDAMQRYQPERAIESLFDWLTLHGKSWSQSDAERWFKALTATIDLIYPTHDEAAA